MRQRYVLLVAPTSAAGLRYWNPSSYWHALNGFPLMHWDWTIVDGRHVPIEPGSRPIAAGSPPAFSTGTGAATTASRSPVTRAARAQAPLRKAPVTPPQTIRGALAGLVGRYRIDPDQIGSGGIVTVALDGPTLIATQPEGGLKLAARGRVRARLRRGRHRRGRELPARRRRQVTRPRVYDYNGQSIVATRDP